MSETRAFKVHPQLLFDVIQRQAGTLTKALCEGVMNSIDAGSKAVDVKIAEDSVVRWLPAELMKVARFRERVEYERAA